MKHEDYILYLENSRHERGRLLAEAKVMLEHLINPDTSPVMLEINKEMAAKLITKMEETT